MKILLVDDDSFLRDMYAMKFTEHKYEVDAVDSAASALRKLESTTDYDVILLDMIMPGMSGVELIKTIKEQFPHVTAKCIVLSNQGQDSDIDGAKEVGAVGYIVKAEMIPSAVVKKVESIMNI